MLNEFAYCPRLCYIEWINSEFVDNADTVDGRFQHRRVDQDLGKVSEDKFETAHARSVFLTGEKVGISCRIDLLERDGRMVTPVEYKRGEAPNIPGGVYEPERVQLCAQGLVLRENGFQCEQGTVYFVRSKKRVPVAFDKVLVQKTKDLISDLRRVAERGQIPPPLQDSPKCNRCSLAGICLPDEVNLLKEMGGRGEPKKGLIRRLLPARDDALPVYVVGHGHTVRKKGDRLEIWSKDKLGGNDGKVNEARLREISQVNLYGGVEITTPAFVELMQRGVPVLHFTHGGWFQGISIGHTHKNVELRIKQSAWAADRKKSLSIARCLIFGKIKNCRTQIRRNDPNPPPKTLELLDKLSRDAKKASSMEKLLGIEGAAAEAYFSRLDDLLKGDQGFSFLNRNKRPPLDPVNAVLSYLYGILAKDLFATLLAVGFDPYLGFYHQPRYGRPALALDMMEEFRPIIADSAAITLFNNGELLDKDFIKTGIGISLKRQAKRTVVGGYERRIQTEITHPIFGYKVSYRRVLEVQARLLARVLSGEIKEYPAFVTR
ncbi:MAG TPA: CRISPR-associated endonuclease Cas1 [Methanotrichaceae archaeon]|nr:CRISPR-associated endonuclease Cas1 [Methanotrichaceae archaeon]